MKCLILLLLAPLFALSQDSPDGHYTVGILPSTASDATAKNYCDNIQATVCKAFVEKDRFTVVDRTKFELLAKERNLQKQEDFLNGPVVEQGKNLGAQYLISSNISQVAKTAGYTQNKVSSLLTKSLPGSNTPVYEIDITITVNMQVIDVQTGSVKSSKSITKHAVTATTDERTAMNAAISQLENDVRIWANDAFPVRMKIIRVETTDKKGLPETVLIKGGGDIDLSHKKTFGLLNSSSLLEVYEEQIEVIDGKTYKRPVTIGKLKIDKVQGELSICKVKDGAEQIQKKLNEGKTLLLKIITY